VEWRIVHRRLRGNAFRVQPLASLLVGGPRLAKQRCVVLSDYIQFSHFISSFTGEIDVAEGVNNQTHNQYTLHTAEGKDGCKASTSNVQISGTPGQTTQCATINGDNTGCAYLDTDNRSYGEGFNQAGGGVFAHLWNQDGIKAWHFARDEVPADIKSGSPDPSTWGPPAAFCSSQTCNIPEHFHDHQLVIDTTLCGDWAGAAYMDSGCPGKSCGDAVADPNNFTSESTKSPC
jgi:hypothetical protein